MVEAETEPEAGAEAEVGVEVEPGSGNHRTRSRQADYISAALMTHTSSQLDLTVLPSHILDSC